MTSYLGSTTLDTSGTAPPTGAPYGGSYTAGGSWLPPPYPGPPDPTGSGTDYTVTSVSEINTRIAAGDTAGSVITIADGVYEDCNLSSAGFGTDGVTWAAATQWGAVITEGAPSGPAAVTLDSAHSDCNLWGVHVANAGAGILDEGTNNIYKWLKVDSIQAGQPCVRHRGGSGFRLMFSDIQHGINTQDEGLYVGWGSDPTLYSQDDIQSIGNTYRVSGGGCMDIKANTSNFLSDLDIVDGIDHFSGCVNVLGGWHLLSPAQRAAVGDVIFRRTIVQATQAPSSTNGHAFRISGTSTIERGICVGTGVSKAAFFYWALEDLTVDITDMRATGFPDVAVEGNGGGVVTVTGTTTETSGFTGVTDNAARESGIGTNLRRTTDTLVLP